MHAAKHSDKPTMDEIRIITSWFSSRKYTYLKLLISPAAINNNAAKRAILLELHHLCLRNLSKTNLRLKRTSIRLHETRKNKKRLQFLTKTEGASLSRF
jgi:hypothetical protein